MQLVNFLSTNLYSQGKIETKLNQVVEKNVYQSLKNVFL